MHKRHFFVVVLLGILGLMCVNSGISEADGGPPSVTLATATGKGTVTLTTNHPGQCFFENIEYNNTAATPAVNSPQTVGFFTRTLLESQLPEQDPNHDYPFGLIQLNIYCTGLKEPMSVDVIMRFSGSSDMSGYMFRKYGPTPDNSKPHWYDFFWNGSTGEVGVSGNTVTLRYVDAKRGDANTAGPDYQIFDPVGPTPVINHPVPAVTIWGLLVFMSGAGLAGAYLLMRRRLKV